QLKGKLRRQIERDRSDDARGLVDIDGRHGVKRHRSGHDEIWRNATPARLAPFDAAFTDFSPFQRGTLMVKPKRAACRDDPLQQLGRQWRLPVAVAFGTSG